MSTTVQSTEDQGAARYFRKPTAADVEKGIAADALIEGSFQGVSGYFDQPYYKDIGQVSRQEFAAAWSVDAATADIFIEKSMASFQNKYQAIQSVKNHDKDRRAKASAQNAATIAQELMDQSRKLVGDFSIRLRKAAPIEREIPDGHLGTPNSDYGKPKLGPKEDMLTFAEAAKKWGFDAETFALIVKHGIEPYEPTDSRKAIAATAKAIAMDQLVHNEQSAPEFPALFKIELETDPTTMVSLAAAAGKIARKRQETAPNDKEANPSAPQA